CSCHQDLIEIMKLLIDLGWIRNCARHFPPQGFAITLTQTRKPGTQRRDGNSKSLRRFFLIWRYPPAAGDERPQDAKPFRLSFRLKCTLQMLQGAGHDVRRPDQV